jgi:hypothetical protein
LLCGKLGDRFAERCQLTKLTSMVFLALAGIAIANVVASLCVARSEVYNGMQKGLQLMLVWVVPMLGATIVLSVWAHDRMSTSRGRVHSGEDSEWLPGIGPIGDRSHPTSTFGDSGSADGHGGDVGGHGN